MPRHCINSPPLGQHFNKRVARPLVVQEHGFSTTGSREAESCQKRFNNFTLGSTTGLLPTEGLCSLGGRVGRAVTRILPGYRRGQQGACHSAAQSGKASERKNNQFRTLSWREEQCGPPADRQSDGKRGSWMYTFIPTAAGRAHKSKRDGGGDSLGTVLAGGLGSKGRSQRLTG